MIVKEMSYRNTPIKIHHSEYNRHIVEVGDFKASYEELNVLIQLGAGGTRKEQATAIGKSYYTAKNLLDSLRARNTTSSGYRPTTTELAVKAKSYQFLNEFTLIGLKVRIDEAKATKK